MNRLAIITAFLGGVKSRYMIYQNDRILAEKLRMAAQVEGCDGVELCYPADFEHPAILQSLLAQHNLDVSAVNFRSRRTGKWWRGSLTSEIRSERQEVVEDFKRAVARGRDLPYEELDAVCEGRVWTGRQAESNKLVDGHGDFVDAIQKAASLAGMEFDHVSQIKVANLFSKQDSYVLPRPYEAVNEIGRLLSREWLHELNGRPLMLMPISLNFVYLHIINKRFNVLILDESHTIKSTDSLIFKISKELSRGIGNRILLTGTPFGNTLIDIWSQYYIIDFGETFYHTFYLFRNTYFEDKGYWGPLWKPTKSGKKKITEKLYTRAIRYKESECEQLPPKVFRKLEYNLSKEQRKDYTSLLEDSQDGLLKEIKVKAIALREIASGFIGSDYTYKNNPKLELL